MIFTLSVNNFKIKQMSFLYIFSPFCFYFIKSTHRIYSNHQFLIGTILGFVKASIGFIFTILFILTVFRFDNVYVCFFLLNNAEGPPNIFLLIYNKARKYIRNAKRYNQTIITFFHPPKGTLFSL